MTLNPDKRYGVRYSFDIDADIEAGWTSHLTLCETREELEDEIWGYYPSDEHCELAISKIRQRPDGMWGVHHHDGLACVLFDDDPETLEEARELFEAGATEAAIHGHAATGSIRVVAELASKDGLTHYLIEFDEAEPVSTPM